MQICLDGFGKYADTLHIDIPKHADWQALTSILAIGGVTYYYTQGGTIGIRYNKSVSPIDVAAQALIVTTAFCETPVNEVEIVVKDRFNSGVNQDEVAREIQFRMRTMSAPADVALSQVMTRGEAPAYYLK